MTRMDGKPYQQLVIIRVTDITRQTYPSKEEADSVDPPTSTRALHCPCSYSQWLIYVETVATEVIAIRNAPPNPKKDSLIPTASHHGLG